MNPPYLSGSAVEPGGNQWSVCEGRAGSEHRGYHWERDRNRSTGNTAWSELPACREIREHTDWGGETLHTVSEVCVCVYTLGCVSVMMLSAEERMFAQRTVQHYHPSMCFSRLSSPLCLPPISFSRFTFMFFFSFFSLCLFIPHLPTCSSRFTFLVSFHVSVSLSFRISPLSLIFPNFYLLSYLYFFFSLSTFISDFLKKFFFFYISVSSFIQLSPFLHTPALYLSWFHVSLLSFVFSLPFFPFLCFRSVCPALSVPQVAHILSFFSAPLAISRL